MAGITIEVRFNNLPAISAKVKPTVDAEIGKALLRIEGKAKGRAPVDTGALRAGIAARPPNEVASTAAYSAHQNYGTSRGVPATHYFDQPVQEEAGQLAATLGAVLGGALR